MVKDLEWTVKFLVAIFDAKEIYSNASLTVKYFLMDDLWVALNK